MRNCFTKSLFVTLPLSILLASCGNESSETGSTKDSGSTNTTTQTTTTNPEQPAAIVQAEDGPAIATIETDTYIAKLHRAIPFVPKDDAVGLFKVKDGHQFVALDLSIRNKTNDTLDMGPIMLAADTKVEGGKDAGNLMAIAAYVYTNPNPNHQPQYEAMWGKILPGGFHRTVALGMEVPKDAKNFVLSLKTKSDFFAKETKEAKFSIQ